MDKPDADSKGWDAYSCCRNGLSLGLEGGNDILSEVVGEGDERSGDLGGREVVEQ